MAARFSVSCPNSWPSLVSRRILRRRRRGRRLIKDDPVVASNARGTVTFAMRGKHTRTTQLFVNFVNNARLDKEGFAPIGRVVGGGMVAVDRINTAHREQPSQGKIHSRGREYLKAEFPDLSYILTARVISPSSPTQQQQDATPVEPVPWAGKRLSRRHRPDSSCRRTARARACSAGSYFAAAFSWART